MKALITRLVPHAVFALLALVTASGCVPAERPKHVTMYPTSGAPPARRVELKNEETLHAVTVTSGVAFAISISDDCPYPKGAPPTLTIADPSVLGGRLLARGTAKTDWVLWGIAPGKTTVTLRAECASQTYDVTVVAQR